MSAPKAKVGFNTPFVEQLDFFRKKLNLPSERWDDIMREQHDRAFIVAGAQNADLLKDLNDAVTKAIEQGKGLEEFRKDFAAIVQKNGWTGWTGEGSQRGVAWRTKVIYQTNMATAYAAGRYQQLTDPEFLKLRPYWRYVHNDSVLHPRPLHQHWGNIKLTLRYDHPFWQTHFPPNGWGCMCHVTAVDAPQPGDATKPPAGWDQRNDLGRLPGIDSGFDYAPGKSVVDEMRALVTDKVARLPAQVGAALWEEMPPALSAAQAEVYSTWLQRLAVDLTAKSEQPIVGAMAMEDLIWLKESGKPLPQSAEIRIASAVIDGPKAARHAQQGDAIPLGVWEGLPGMLADPLAVLYDMRKGTMLYVLPEASARRPQVVVEFDFMRSKQPGGNMIISGYRPMLSDLLSRIDNGTLKLMRGSLE